MDVKVSRWEIEGEIWNRTVVDGGEGRGEAKAKRGSPGMSDCVGETGQL